MVFVRKQVVIIIHLQHPRLEFVVLRKTTSLHDEDAALCNDGGVQPADCKYTNHTQKYLPWVPLHGQQLWHRIGLPPARHRTAKGHPFHPTSLHVRLRMSSVLQRVPATLACLVQWIKVLFVTFHVVAVLPHWALLCRGGGCGAIGTVLLFGVLLYGVLFSGGVGLSVV